GWIESLTPEVGPFGIRSMLVEPGFFRSMLVEPGFFRTELLSPESTNYAEPSIDDYAERTNQTVAAWNAMNGKQGGDPAKLAKALVQLASQDEPPLRFAAGADAIATVQQPRPRRRLNPPPTRTQQASATREVTPRRLPYAHPEKRNTP